MRAQEILDSTDPEDLRNIVYRLRQGVDLLQSPPLTVVVNQAPGQYPASSAIDFRAADADGNLRMVMSAYDLFDEIGVHAHQAGINSAGTVTYYVDAEEGRVVFGSGDGWLDEWGLHFANQEGLIGFQDTADGETMALYADGFDYLVLENSYGGRGISMFIDDVSHNVKIIDFLSTGIDMDSGLKYKMAGVNIAYALPYSTHLNFATVGAGATSWASPFLGATASEAGQLVLRAGTAKNFKVRTATAQPGTGSLVLTVRKNGVDTALVITIAAGSAAGNYSDTTHTVSFAADDRIAFKIVNNASGASAQIAPLAVEMETEI